MVKRASFELIELDIPFGDSFEENKKILKDTMPSKKVRNKIAGYIARLKRQEQKQ